MTLFDSVGLFPKSVDLENKIQENIGLVLKLQLAPYRCQVS